MKWEAGFGTPVQKAEKRTRGGYLDRLIGSGDGKSELVTWDL
jgi:hypothetical protein